MSQYQPPCVHKHHHLLLFNLEMKTFQFNCLPFGLCTVPRVVTKILKSISHREAEINGYSPGSVHGRHIHHGNCYQDAQRAYSHNAIPSWEPGIHNQQQGITSHSDPRDWVPWDSSEFPDNGLKAPDQVRSLACGGYYCHRWLLNYQIPPVPLGWVDLPPP